jgi:1-acyl-sn-glycerol-3-phosphate acyltransferase
MRVMPRPEGEPFVSYYNAGIYLLWPWFQAITKRDWRGAQHLGRQGDGMVLAVNHMSWLDPLAVIHYINDNGRSVRVLAKAELFDLPVGGRIIRGTHQIPVYRSSGDAAVAVAAAVEAVNDGECIMVYPEGTLTRDPDLWPMQGKTGAARIALASRKPLVPAAQWGAQEVMPPYQLRFRALPRKTMHVWAGEPVDLGDLYHLEPTAEVLQVATNRLMNAITDLLSEIRGEPAPRGRWDMRTGRREPIGPVSLDEDRRG